MHVQSKKLKQRWRQSDQKAVPAKTTEYLASLTLDSRVGCCAPEAQWVILVAAFRSAATQQLAMQAS